MNTAIRQSTPERAARRPPVVTSRGRRELAAQPLLSALRRDGAGRVPTFGEMSTDDILTLQRIAGNAAVAGLAKGSLAAHSRYEGAAAGRGTGPCARRLGRWTLEGTEAGVIRRQPVESPSGGGSGSGGCAVQDSGADPRRFIADDLCLLSTDLKGDSRLNDAFHNNPPLTPKDNTPKDPTGPVGKFQKGLIVVGENLGKDGADGEWGSKTTQAVASFQSKNGIQPGGFEAGRKTLLALDAHLQQRPPKPPPPAQQAVLNDPCQQVQGQTASPDTVDASGAGFPPGTTIELLLDGAKVGAALADADGNINGSVAVSAPSSGRQSHVLEAKASAVHAFRPFTVPCGSVKPPGPVPGPSDAVLETVLNQIDFAHEEIMISSRDGVEQFGRDTAKLDQPKLSPGLEFLVAALNIVEPLAYGFVEGSIRINWQKALAGLLGKSRSDTEVWIGDNGADKGFDAAEQFAKGEFNKKITPTAESLQDLAITYVDRQLDEVTKNQFVIREAWIKDTKPRFRGPLTPKDLKDLETSRIPPDPSGDRRIDRARLELESLKATARTAKQDRYVAARRGWTEEIMQDPAVGGRADLRQTTAIDPNTGKPKQGLDLRPLKRGGSNDDIPKTGVIRVGLAPLLPHPSDAVSFVDPSAGGLSKRLRAQLVKDGALFGTCKVAVVLEGKVTHGAGFFFQDGTIRVGINEDGDGFDLTEDNSNGETWLKERGGGNRAKGFNSVFQQLKGTPIPPSFAKD
jgi:peptidoglycan hydrolase-like protein with peptidoglycan-binding domain